MNMMQPLGTVLVALFLSVRGFRKKSLSSSGAFAAFAVGCLHLGTGVPWAATLLAFYFSSSKLTKLGADIKRTSEADYKAEGQRNAVQVLSNSAGACAALVLYQTLQHDSSVHGLIGPTILQATRVDITKQSDVMKLQACCVAAFLGHYACCCADTWASELGILSQGATRLITQPWRAVPKGTNGGVTVTGMAASTAGALFIAVTWACTNRILSFLPTLPAQPAIDRLGVAGVLAMCAVCGIAGSVLDSLLGATLQYSGWDGDRKVVVSHPAPHAKHISGLNVLSNSQVNAVASTCMAASAVFWVLHTNNVNMA